MGDPVKSHLLRNGVEVVGGWGLFLGVAAVGDLAYDVTCDP